MNRILGIYATDPAYPQKIRNMVRGILNDHKKIHNSRLEASNTRMYTLRNSVHRMVNLSEINGVTDPNILFMKGELRREEIENEQIRSDIEE